MAVMAGEGLVIAMPSRTVVDKRGDFRAARGAGDIDVAQPVSGTCEQIGHRNKHSQQSAPMTQAVEYRRPAVREHEFTLVVGKAGLARQWE